MLCTARLVRWGLLLGLVVSLPSWAQWDTTRAVNWSQPSTTRVVGLPNGPLRDLLAPKTVTAGATEGSALLKELLQGPGPKTAATVEVARSLPWSKIGKGIIRGLPALGTAVAVLEILEAVRCREGFNAGPECDLGTDETTQQVTTWIWTYNALSSTCLGYSHAACGSSPVAAVSNALPSLNYTAYGNTHTFYGAALVSQDANSAQVTFEHRQCNSSNQCSEFGPTQVTVATQTGQQTACPIITINGVQLVPVKGSDGKCPTNVYTPVADQVAEDRITNYGPKDKGLPAWGELIDRPIAVPHDAPGFTVTSPKQVERRTTVQPDGTTIVRDTEFPWYSAPDGYGWIPRVVEKTYPPGATIPPEGEIGDGTVTEGGPAPGQEIITCGLPGTPPCKIDETGTPTPPADDSVAKAEGYIAPGKNCVENPSACIPALPDLNWGFSLPSGCSVIPLPGFGQWMAQGVDICAYQPMIHDLMSMIWAAGGLFAGVGMMFRGST